MSNDLISRSYLKQMLPAPIEDEYKYVHKIIDNAPTVTPDMAQVLAYESGKASAERPTGKWLEHWSKELSEKGFYQCSRCKAGFQRYERGTRHSELPWIDGQKYELHCIDNYCPNCGAKMK